jgi:hypothetical protein
MENARSLADFVQFLRLLNDAGVEYVVIGGCAVGAYAMVAVLRFQGQEINLLTETFGLPAFDTVVREAREFRLEQAQGLEVPLADPFMLLANKLAIRRERDRPHIDLLRAFIDEEIVDSFRREENAPVALLDELMSKSPPDLRAELHAIGERRR